MPIYKEKQNEDVDKAIKNYNQATQKSESDLRAKGVAEKMTMRKNILDKLNDDFNNAGRSDYEKQIWGK